MPNKLTPHLVAGMDEDQTQKLLSSLEDNGYFNLRVLEDGTVIGLGKLMYTTALHIGLDHLSWERRYCYDSPALAKVAINNLQNGDEKPLAGYIAKRGRNA